MEYPWLQTLSWHPSPTQLAQFDHLYQAITLGNQTLNLTRILQPEAFWEKHLWDSLWAIQPHLSPPSPPADPPPLLDIPLRDRVQVIDIGTGGGFPGIPVAIAHPTWEVTLLDATHKKITFLQTLCQILDLPQVKTHCDRAETTGHDPNYRDQFDLALIRAVASPNVCAEYALPFLKPNGIAILYCGQWSTEDIPLLNQALALLGGHLHTLRHTQTPLTQSQRHCLYLRKTQPTPPTYPRAIGKPMRKPL